MANNHEEREIPTAACRFAGGAVTFAAGEPDTTAAPISMLARTAQPIEHWYWGRVVHDMDGMRRHKDVLPCDYVHEEECGYLDTFEFDAERNLRVAGKLVPTSAPDDIARKIIERSKGGVPYEASIDWSGDGIVAEEVSEGFSVPVNGYQFQGPGIVIRQWPLRGVAVCPYGADMNTETSLTASRADKLRCTFVKSNPNSESTEVQMAENTELQEVAATQEVNDERSFSTSKEAAAVTDPPTDEPKTQQVEPQQEVTDAANDRTEAKRFLDAFGDKGPVWFAEGLAFDEARDREVTELRAEVERLTKKLAARPAGEETPIGFDAADDQKKRTGFAGKYRIRN